MAVDVHILSYGSYLSSYREYQTNIATHCDPLTIGLILEGNGMAFPVAGGGV